MYSFSLFSEPVSHEKRRYLRYRFMQTLPRDERNVLSYSMGMRGYLHNQTLSHWRRLRNARRNRLLRIRERGRIHKNCKIEYLRAWPSTIDLLGCGTDCPDDNANNNNPLRPIYHYSGKTKTHSTQPLAGSICMVCFAAIIPENQKFA